MNKQIGHQDFNLASAAALAGPLDFAADQALAASTSNLTFRVLKRWFDIVITLCALPFVGAIAAILLLLNPLWNPGPLLFLQTRMGRDCKPFRAVKFRTMRPAERIRRGPDDPLEADRITPLGHVLRRSRFDELPQFLNVLAGEMSVIGPRPDFWNHAKHYLRTVPGYRQRHTVRPGITGLAQVDGGYAEGVDATLEKTRLDLRYLRAGSFAMETYILSRTVVVLLTGFGAR
ncbi:MAG: sugar transferase [Paracoccaceae bacterium]|nr:sugar transferase [Paracoccaceae bacterium]